MLYVMFSLHSYLKQKNETRIHYLNRSLKFKNDFGHYFDD